MFLSMAATKTNTLTHLGARIVSQTIKEIGAIADHFDHTSQVGKQFNKLNTELRRRTYDWPLSERVDAFNYGADCLFGDHVCTCPSANVQRVVAEALKKAKAA